MFFVFFFCCLVFIRTTSTHSSYFSPYLISSHISALHPAWPNVDGFIRQVFSLTMSYITKERNAWSSSYHRCRRCLSASLHFDGLSQCWWSVTVGEFYRAVVDWSCQCTPMPLYIIFVSFISWETSWGLSHFEHVLTCLCVQQWFCVSVYICASGMFDCCFLFLRFLKQEIKEKKKTYLLR